MKPVLAVFAIALWVGAFFLVPMLPSVVAGLAAYLVLLNRADYLSDEYLEARTAVTRDPFGPRPLRRPWYRDRGLTASLRRMSANVALYQRHGDPAVDALRRRANRAYWAAALAAIGVTMVGFFGQALVGRLWW